MNGTFYLIRFLDTEEAMHMSDLDDAERTFEASDNHALQAMQIDGDGQWTDVTREFRDAADRIRYEADRMAPISEQYHFPMRAAS